MDDGNPEKSEALPASLSPNDAAFRIRRQAHVQVVRVTNNAVRQVFGEDSSLVKEILAASNKAVTEFNNLAAAGLAGPNLLTNRSIEWQDSYFSEENFARKVNEHAEKQKTPSGFIRNLVFQLRAIRAQEAGQIAAIFPYNWVRESHSHVLAKSFTPDVKFGPMIGSLIALSLLDPVDFSRPKSARHNMIRSIHRDGRQAVNQVRATAREVNTRNNRQRWRDQAIDL